MSHSTEETKAAPKGEHGSPANQSESKNHAPCCGTDCCAPKADMVSLHVFTKKEGE